MRGECGGVVWICTLNPKDNKERSSVRVFERLCIGVFVCLWSAVSATCNFFKPKIDTSAICMLTKVQKCC